MPKWLKDIRLGFRASIITLFVSVVLLVGLTLVYFSFDRVGVIIRSAASTYIDKVAEHAGDRIDAQFRHVHDSVQILSMLPSVQEAHIDDPALHALMAAMLRGNTELFSLYAGYDDGSFVQMDFIDRAGNSFRDKLAAPPDAVFRLWRIQKQPSGEDRIARTSLLDEALKPVAESRAATDYDPRNRPWYVDAFDAHSGVLTEPYIFFATDEPGYTLRLPLRGGRKGVVAGDMLLGDADALFRSQRIGRTGVAFLFDDADRIVAHPKMSELIGPKAGNSAVQLPRLSAVYKSALPEAVRAWQAGDPPQQFFEDADGRTYVASFRSIATASSAHLHLAVLAPLDEFFSTLLTQRRYLFIMALAIVAAMIPPVFWLGSMLSHSIRAIAAETDRIQRFEPGDGALRRSVIDEIDYLGQSVFTMRKVIETFATFVPKRLVQRLVETGTAFELGGTRREVTMMFTDVENFTGLTEQADPERVMSYTSRYFAVMSETIMARKGTVDKFMGDAVMAIWNAPAEDPDHIANSCAAVLACQKANRDLNLTFVQEGWPAYRTRFGLHCGNVVVGNIGSLDRMNYTVLGASVNLAARLEALNKTYGTTALASAQIKDRTDGRFLFRSVDHINPKGFAEKFPIFELRAAFEDADEDERAMCEAWERIYASFAAADPERSLRDIEAFLRRYPDDGVAKYHASAIHLRRSSEPQDAY